MFGISCVAPGRSAAVARRKIDRTGRERKCRMALESMRNCYRTSAKGRAVKAVLDAGGRVGNAKPCGASLPVEIVSRAGARGHRSEERRVGKEGRSRGCRSL